jgi:putative endonuclease
VTTGSTRHHGGLAAEETAARLYLAEGASLEAARWRCAEGEIDLVMRFPGLLVFVEVKARSRPDPSAPAITARQWRRIAAAASRYLADNTDGTVPCRFDAVVVDATGRPVRYENAASFDEW